MNPSVKKIIPLQILRDLKTKPLPQLHDYHLQLLLISHHYLHVLLCLDYLPLPFPVPSAKPEAQLHQRNILWTSVTSTGQRLPLPLDSCCSVSLVSKVHADFIASK